jgi:hypothetical protein
MSETIVLIVDDLMFLPKLEGTLRTLEYQPITAINDVDLSRALYQAPVLIIVDLFSRGFDWEPLVRLIKGPGKKANHVPVLGFGPHVDLELRQRALAVGCDAVVGRSAIVGQLPNLVEKHKWTVDRSRCQDALPPLLVRQGLKLFNQGEYFECHEILEEAWLEETAPVRLMYQGILQIGVSLYHVKNKNWRGAMKVLDRGVPKASRFAPQCMGINITKLLNDAEAVRHELMRLGPEWQGEFDKRLFPTIEFQEIS